MAYSCYVRYEGRGFVEVQPAVTIRFDQITTVTCNRIRRVLQDNYNPYSWSSKPSAMLNAMQGHYKVFTNLLAPTLMNHSDFDAEMFSAKALLLGFEFKVIKQGTYWHGYGSLQYKGDKSYADRKPQRLQLDKLKEDTLLPIARSLIDHTRLAPILEALESRRLYTFTGINMR